MREVVYDIDLNLQEYDIKACMQNDDINLIVNIFKKEKPYDLTGAKATLNWSKPDGTPLRENMNIDKNMISVTLNKDYTDIKGKARLDIEITKEGTVSTFPLCLVIVEKIFQSNKVNNKIVELLDIIKMDEHIDEFLDNIKQKQTELSSQIAEKAKQSDLEIERTRITNLATLKEGSTTGDAELIDGRVSADGTIYDSIGENIRDIGTKINTIVSKYTFDTVDTTLPYTKICSSGTWCYIENLLLTKTWADYSKAYIIIDINISNIKEGVSLSTSNISLTAKRAISEVISYATLKSPSTKIVDSETFRVKYFINIPSDSNYLDGKMLYLQFGQLDSIGSIIATIENVAIFPLETSDYSEAEKMFDIYGYNKGTVISNINYENINNKPALNGKELTKESKIEDYQEEIEKIFDTNLSVVNKFIYKNIAKSIDLNSINCNIASGTTEKISNSDGSVTFKGIANSTNVNHWFYLKDFILPETWKGNHKYLIALNVSLDECPQSRTDDSTTGNFNFNMLAPSSNGLSNGIIHSKIDAVNSIITEGNCGDLIAVAAIDETKLNESDKNNFIFLQIGNVKPGSYITITLKDVCVLDLTELGLNNNEALTLFNKYKYIKEDIINKFYDINVSNSENSKYAEEANSVKDMSIKTDCEIWGDSLIAQGYGNIIGEILGRNIITKGYGGKTSTYIRDKFLAEADVNKVQIINIGRNNYFEPDVVIDDIRKMVEIIPHNNFLICCPPNGNYGEGIGTSAYENFVKIENILSKQYPANFLNTRLNTIYEYDMGNSKLLENFIQPEIGSSVTIKVDNAEFLTTYNSNDLDKWGEEFMKKVAIGLKMDSLDIYSVDRYDLENNTLTITLIENNSGKASGTNIGNSVDNGGLDSIKYCKVLQYADYYCYKSEITQSTFRKDGIHMSDIGKLCIAKVVARKINTMKI